jgi:ABC transporter
MHGTATGGELPGSSSWLGSHSGHTTKGRCCLSWRMLRRPAPVVVFEGLRAELADGATGIVGPSGVGKSRLLRLLNRLADPTVEAVRNRGRDLREQDVLALRREVGLVPQLPALLEGSIAENVLYGPRLASRDADVAESFWRGSIWPSALVGPTRYRAVSSHRSCSPGRLRDGRRCCCSTSPPRRWTRRRRPRSRPRFVTCATPRPVSCSHHPRPRPGRAARRPGSVLEPRRAA